jgi:allantoin racemase
MIVNPNSSLSLTEGLVASARQVAQRADIVAGRATRAVPVVETNVDEVWGSVSVIEQVAQGELEGIDGYVIACFGDTGLAAARELANGPVVGMTEAALLTATLLAHRFVIVTLPPRTMAQSDRVVWSLGLAHRCTVRAVDVGVAELVGGAAHLFDLFADAAQRGIDEEAAEAVILGCAGLSELAPRLQAQLGVPVIDGVTAAVGLIEGLVEQGLSTSRAGTYARAVEPSADLRQ